MKISELIAHLQAERLEIGDLDVYVPDASGNNVGAPAVSTAVYVDDETGERTHILICDAETTEMLNEEPNDGHNH